MLDVETHGIPITQLIIETCDYILSCQGKNGGILWFADGKLDPWDHTEATMGLTIGGHYSAAQKAFAWLEEHQNADGSWYAKYQGDENDGDKDRNKIETNFVAYPACGLWHYFLVTEDASVIERFFPMVKRAMDFVLTHQNPEGDIQWAFSTVEDLPQDSLVTASASILRSLECALLLGRKLEIETPGWTKAYQRLADALLNKPWRFDRSWESKTRFSMDWFYPILSGVYSAQDADKRLEKRWQEFIHPDYGCRCVSDEPWITVAESCELTLALLASKQKTKARRIFSQLLRWQDVDGGFWTGYSFRDKKIWPMEKTSWTAAAVLLAFDALEQITPAHGLFTSPSHLFFPQNTE